MSMSNTTKRVKEIRRKTCRKFSSSASQIQFTLALYSDPIFRFSSHRINPVDLVRD